MPASNPKMKRPAAAVADTVTVALLKKGKFSGGATKKCDSRLSEGFHRQDAGRLR